MVNDNSLVDIGGGRNLFSVAAAITEHGAMEGVPTLFEMEGDVVSAGVVWSLVSERHSMHARKSAAIRFHQPRVKRAEEELQTPFCRSVGCRERRHSRTCLCFWPDDEWRRSQETRRGAAAMYAALLPTES